jgi:hypothetical protein
MKKNNLVDGFNLDLKDKLPFCETCAFSKSKIKPYPKKHKRKVVRLPKTKDLVKSTTVSDFKNRRLGLVHMDAGGPFPLSFDRKKYILLFIDTFSNKMFNANLSSLSECVDEIVGFARRHLNLTKTSVGVFRADNATYFAKSRKLARWLDELAISRQFSAPRSPAQNGKAENGIGYADSLARAFMIHADAPQKLWSLAMNQGILVSGCFPHPHKPGTTPDELFNGVKPDVSWIRVWGCVAYMHIHKEIRGPRSKFKIRALRLMHVGWDSGVRKCYILYYPASGKIYYSRDVVFDETTMYFSADPDKKSIYDFLFETTSPLSEVPEDIPSDDDDFLPGPLPVPVPGFGAVRFGPDLPPAVVLDPSPPVRVDIPDPLNPVIDLTVEPQEAKLPLMLDAKVPEGRVDGSVLEAPVDFGQPDPAVELQIDDLPVPEAIVPERRYPVRSNRRQAPPRLDPTYDRNNTQRSHAYAAEVKDEDLPPLRYKDAIASVDSDRWLESMAKEIETLKEQPTWCLVPLPPGRKAIGCRWVQSQACL